MEGKTVILSVFIMSLVLVQTQVEAGKICCPSRDARNNFSYCRVFEGKSRETCLARYGCKTSNGACPPGYPISKDFLENSGNDVNEYCKVGCVSSVCSALNTLQNSDASEIVTGAVDQCAKACSTFCTKGSMTSVEVA